MGIREQVHGQERGDTPLRVLLINQYYPPDTSATAGLFSDLVEGLTTAGHEVRVLCGRPSYNAERRFGWRPLQTSVKDNVRVEHLGSASKDRERMLGRVINYLSFIPLAALRGLFTRRPDVVIVGSDPPMAVTAALVAAKGRPVVYSLQDVHPETAIESGMIRPGIISMVWRSLHLACLKRCAAVACISDEMATFVRKRGVPAPTIKVVPNGAWPPTSKPIDNVVQEIRQDADFVVMHAGNLGASGSWQCLIKAAQRLNNGSRLLFVGGGFKSDELQKSGPTLIPFKESDQLASVMESGDLQIVTQRRGMEGLGFPSKLYSVLAHGRPVLAVATPESELATFVLRSKCGIVADPDDAEDVVRKVQWARSNPQALRVMGVNARNVASEFDRGRLLSRFVHLVESVVAHSRH